MHIKKHRWSRTYEAAEVELIEILGSSFDNMPQRITVPDQEIIELATTDETSIWCAEGSLTISNDTQRVALQAGDTVVLSASQKYEILSGFTGCVYYQEA